jgi:Flp pilus assembly pilin Flp
MDECMSQDFASLPRPAQGGDQSAASYGGDARSFAFDILLCDRLCRPSISSGSRTVPVCKSHAIRGIQSDSGATAIEYAVIAALIGLGLIGSLVGTRSSISAVFGVASSQMASANTQSAGSSPAALPPSAFASKTLKASSKASNAFGGYTYQYQYSDGSSATFLTNPTAAAYNFQLSSWDPVLNQSKYANANKTGDMNSVQIIQYDSSSNVTLNSRVGNADQTPIGVNPLSGTQMNTTTYVNNNPTGTSATPAQALVDYSNLAPSDLAYFRSISN